MDLVHNQFLYKSAIIYFQWSVSTYLVERCPGTYYCVHKNASVILKVYKLCDEICLHLSSSYQNAFIPISFS